MFSSDLTWWLWIDAIWTFLEMASGIVAACLPCTPKFFKSLKELHLCTCFAPYPGSASNSKFHPRSSSLGKEKARSYSSPGQQGREWPTSNYASLSDKCDDVKHSTGVRPDSDFEMGTVKTRPEAGTDWHDTIYLKDLDTLETA